MSKSVIIVVCVLICLGSLFAISRISQDFDPTAIACLASVESDMTPQELSQTFGIPLVTFVSAPDFIIDEPSVEPYVWYPIETPKCGLRIKYFANDDTTHPFIEIVVRNMQTTETNRTDWSCFNYEFESMPPDTDLKSVCSNHIEASGRQIFVSVSTIYDMSATRELVEGFDLQVEFFD